MSAGMTLRQVKGNTWVIEGWQMIPLYQLPGGGCILLDSGLARQQQAIEGLLRSHGLTCRGILNSHAHMDHTGNNGFFQTRYGAKIAMSLGEAGLHTAPLGLQVGVGNLSPGQLRAHRDLSSPSSAADVVIRKGEGVVTFCGAEFQVHHTPGHSVDHICVTTPDGVCYLGDAVMTGPTLVGAKFPFMVSMEDCLKSLRLLREIKAEAFVAAHGGVYPEILPYVDMELHFLRQRMKEILRLAEGVFSLEDMTVRIGCTLGIRPKDVEDALYFERASKAYLHYLLDQGLLETLLQQDRVRYRRTKGRDEGFFWEP